VIYPNTRIKWQQLGLVPTTNLQFWHMYEAGVSGNNVIYDYSANARNLSTAQPDPPILTSNVLNGQPGWYFDGTNDLLEISGGSTPAFTLKHLFVILKVNTATFPGSTTIPVLATSGPNVIEGVSGTTEWTDLGGASTYRKNDVLYGDNDWQAPMQEFALMEIVLDGAGTTGITNITLNESNDFNGYFVEWAGYSAELTYTQRRRMLLYYALRYGVHLTTDSAVPLYFPSSDLIGTGVVSDAGAIRERFNSVPRDWNAITEDYEFEDANKTFNEHGDDPPRQWEYVYVNVSKSQAQLFDVFNDTARKANSFYFKDPEGFLWDNVRIENYNRSHDAHKRWVNRVEFRLVGYNSTGTYEG
jgi:hypothetical protein